MRKRTRKNRKTEQQEKINGTAGRKRKGEKSAGREINERSTSERKRGLINGQVKRADRWNGRGRKVKGGKGEIEMKGGVGEEHKGDFS